MPADHVSPAPPTSIGATRDREHAVQEMSPMLHYPVNAFRWAALAVAVLLAATRIAVPRPVCAGFGPDLRGLRAPYASWRSAQLRGVRLERAVLRGADLFGADLLGADLSGAD